MIKTNKLKSSHNCFYLYDSNLNPATLFVFRENLVVFPDDSLKALNSSTMSRNARSSSNSGCFSNVLRRLLCSGSPQTHPSDHIAEPDTTEFDGVGQVRGSETGPGIVARLMGLDSLPEKNWVQKRTVAVADSVTRSRSVNFMDYMLEFDFSQAKHRRVKTSASFREVLQHDKINHEFLVVCMDNDVDNGKELSGFKPRKISEKRNGSCSKPAKQKENVMKEKAGCKKENKEKNKKIAKLKNEPRRVSGKHNSLKVCINGDKDVQINHGANLKAKSTVLTRKRKNQREHKKLGYSENNSEGLIPVSEDSKLLELNKSKKKCPSKSVKYDSHTMDISAGIISITDHDSHEKKQELFSKKNSGSTAMEETDEYFMELVGKPGKLTEEDIKFSNWTETMKFPRFEDFEDICFEFGEQILDLMLHQVADELVM